MQLLPFQHQLVELILVIGVILPQALYFRQVGRRGLELARQDGELAFQIGDPLLDRFQALAPLLFLRRGGGWRVFSSVWLPGLRRSWRPGWPVAFRDTRDTAYRCH